MSLPHLLCRACERQIKNFVTFKTLITESQKSFKRVKRCTKISPLVTSTLMKSTKESDKRSRRGLLYDEHSSAQEISHQDSGEDPLDISTIGNVKYDEVHFQVKRNFVIYLLTTVSWTNYIYNQKNSNTKTCNAM